MGGVEREGERGRRIRRTFNKLLSRIIVD